MKTLLEISKENPKSYAYMSVKANETDKILSVDENNMLTLISRAPLCDEETAKRVRHKRDGLLAQSDWTQMPDCPLSAEQKNAWAAYRQALRDIPAQNGFPTAVVWAQI